MKATTTDKARAKLAAMGFTLQPSNSDHTNRYIIKQIGSAKFWGMRTIKEAVGFAEKYKPMAKQNISGRIEF
jgi:hypothetical protein